MLTAQTLVEAGVTELLVNNDFQSIDAFIQVLAALTKQRLTKNRQSNDGVIALVLAYCSAHKLTEQETRTLRMAAALYNIGKLTWHDDLISQPSDRLTKAQRESYREYPVIGEKLLITLQAAQDAAVLIRHHQERWDGAGDPDGLMGDSIPWGARLIKLAVDTVEMQMGMIQERELTRKEALVVIAQYAGRIYDPILCRAFIEVVTNLSQGEGETDDAVVILSTRKLEPGMILVKKLYSAAGTLLLGEGKELSLRLIQRLQEYEHDEGVDYKLHVRHPEAENNNEQNHTVVIDTK